MVDGARHTGKAARGAQARVRAQWRGERAMTDPVIPETAPAHTEARDRFSPRDIAVVAALGGLAIVIGTVLGLVLTA